MLSEKEEDKVNRRMKRVGLIHGFIIPGYDALHSQSREHVTEDALGALSISKCYVFLKEKKGETVMSKTTDAKPSAKRCLHQFCRGEKEEGDSQLLRMLASIVKTSKEKE